MVEKTAKINSENGIHLRPGLDVVDMADNYESDITITSPLGVANAKSIMQVTILCLAKGAEVTIKADGTDEQEAVDAMVKILESDFERESVKE